MDRVRSLIGNHRGHARNRQRHPYSHNETPSTTNILGAEGDGDDQSTIFAQETIRPGTSASEGDDGTDAATLNTAISEGSTIGDLQRQGFINRAPRFTSERIMPFVSILLQRGFFAFPSEESFQLFLHNKRKLDNIDPKTGLGLPLFHAVSLNLVKSLFSNQNTPVMRVYKYVIIDSRYEKPPPNSEQISQIEENVSIYKFEFCTILKIMESHDFSSRVEHNFIFHRNNEPDIHIPMINYNQRKNADTTVHGLNLRWYGTTSLASPFGSNNINLLVLDDTMASYMDQQTIEEYDSYCRSRPTRPLGYLPVWARYTDDKVSVIPKKRILRVATFYMRETDLFEDESGSTTTTAHATYNQTSSNIIDKIPWDSQVLTCMCMLLHEYESRKEKRHTAWGSSTAYMLNGPAGLLM
ncbi:YNL165W [Saccharomyces arboricola H-6]|uniref:YNL165W n=1 Tax=Saccharomyces arboricola (strain H-6 / AS 2.3317 / CBS 10644) TaxID=1160507 RepID=J8LIU6_SACAR|nr:YNL165W [Saccharomyces arboricola H-6]